MVYSMEREKDNMVSFVNVFLSYLLLLVVIVIVAGVAVTIGITMRKKKNAEQAVEAVEVGKSE